jgi:hypothetical protein
MKVMDIKILSGMTAVQTAPFMGRKTTARSARSHATICGDPSNVCYRVDREARKTERGSRETKCGRPWIGTATFTPGCFDSLRSRFGWCFAFSHWRLALNRWFVQDLGSGLDGRVGLHRRGGCHVSDRRVGGRALFIGGGRRWGA